MAARIYFLNLSKVVSCLIARLTGIISFTTQPLYVVVGPTDVLEGIKRCTAFEPLLNAFDTSGRHYEQFGLTRLADLVEDCREYSAKVLKRLKVTVFADPELPAPPMARNTSAIGYVIRRLADLHELVAKGTPYWIAYSIVEAKYRDVTPLYPDPGAAAPEPANPQA
jgi:hypothetical protein